MNLLHYDSPVMTILGRIGDLIMLNFIYLLCCIPIFTIGAAQAGMFRATRVMQDPEDDSSVVNAFFKGFADGFGKVTIAWGIMGLLLLFVAYFCITGYIMQILPLWMCVAPVCIVALYQAMIPAFHSRFDCSVKQLLRNPWFLVVTHPLRSIGVAVLIWLPVLVLLLLGMYIFMATGPVLITLYYSTAFLFAYKFLKKPFNLILEDFQTPQTESIEESVQ